MRIFLIKSTVATVFFMLMVSGLYGVEKTNIALGKPYTWSKAPNAFPHGYDGHSMCLDEADKTQLTDGELADRCWWDKRTVGWWSEGTITVTIDLGKEMPINKVQCHLSSEKKGYRVPRRVTVFVSNDNKTFLPVAEMVKSEALKQWHKEMIVGKQDGHPHAWLKIDDINTKGRYVLISFDVVNLYLDEIRIFPGDLDADKITLPSKGWSTSLDLYPFYKRNKAYYANNALLPIHLSVTKKRRHTGIDIFLDLPREIKCVAPKPISFPENIKLEEQEYVRYTLKNAKKLFLTANIPEGTIKKIRIIGRDTYKEKAGTEQILDLESVKIPETRPFKKLIANVGFSDFAYYHDWPEVTSNYKKIGLNMFTPFGHTDYYYLFLTKQNPVAIKLIADAKKQGLIVGANFSPFCNGAINGMVKRYNGRKAVYLNGKTGNTGCPRCYLENLGKDPKYELGQIAAGAKHGIEFFIFDSEPHWTGRICACPECEKKWREFLSHKAPDLPYKSPEAVYQSKSPVYLPLYQQFWDEFYIQLWGTYKNRIQEVTGKKNIPLGLYNCPYKPKQAAGITYNYGNNPLFPALFNRGIVDFANPSQYLIPTEELGHRTREFRNNLPPRCPMYVWVTAGSRGINFERTPEDVRNRLLELFFNGAQGFFFWNAYGVDAKDYQIIAKVIKALQPYEYFFINGTELPESWIKAPEGIKVSGIKLGREAVILVSRYGKKFPEKVTVEVNVPKNLLSPRVAESMTTGEKTCLDQGKFQIEFSGEEKDFCKIFCLHP